MAVYFLENSPTYAQQTSPEIFLSATYCHRTADKGRRRKEGRTDGIAETQPATDFFMGE